MRQSLMFTHGEDLPLFSGAPMQARPAVFNPSPVGRQESLIDLRPDPFHLRKAHEMNSDYYARYVGSLPTEELIDGFETVEAAVDHHLAMMKTVAPPPHPDDDIESDEDIKAGLMREIENELESTGDTRPIWNWQIRE